jgi:hypothetical protein
MRVKLLGKHGCCLKFVNFWGAMGFYLADLKLPRNILSHFVYFVFLPFILNAAVRAAA